MHSVEAKLPSIQEYTGSGYRLIPSRFPPVAVYAGLVANDQFERLVSVESLTNPRLQSQERLLASYGDPNAPQLQNWNRAPFKYINPEGSRFFGPTRPALELAEDAQTALAIAVRRRETFLARTGEPPIGLDMRMLKTPVDGKFGDLRDLPTGVGRDARRDAASAFSIDLDGIMFCPTERSSANCVAVTNIDALGSSIQTDHYRFEWDGQKISSIYAFNNERNKIDVEKLFLAESLSAA